MKKKGLVILFISLLLTSLLTSRTFKKIKIEDIYIKGSKLFTNEEIIKNSSLNLNTPLIFVKTKYIERQLKKSFSLENVSISREVIPFGLKIFIKTRTPVAYGEKIVNNKKVSGFIDQNGYFIEKKFIDKKFTKKLSTSVFGWKEIHINKTSEILNLIDKYDFEFININFSPNGFLTIEEKNLKRILLGLDTMMIEVQLQSLKNIKNQLKEKKLQDRIDYIDLTDPKNPIIKVFKP